MDFQELGLRGEVTRRSNEAKLRSEVTRDDSTGRSIAPGFPPQPPVVWDQIPKIAVRARNPWPKFDARKKPCNAERNPSS